MKLPFDFANKLLLRLVLPGALLTAALWPLLLFVLDQLRIVQSDKVVVPAAIVVLGWIVLLLDMPIYMLAEGRRFWPSWAIGLGLRLEQRRLNALLARRMSLPRGSQALVECDLAIRRFPINTHGRPEALLPTRLGNLIYSSETYPDRKYGLDGVFGWYRIWVAVGPDVRGELDEQQAIVDSALYAAFISLIAAALCVLYAGLVTWSVPFVRPMPEPPVLWGAAGMCLLLSLLFYRATLHLQSQYGEIFCALFDQNIDKVRFPQVLDELDDAFGDAGLRSAPNRIRMRAAVRFLKYHRFRPKGSRDNRVVDGW